MKTRTHRTHTGEIVTGERLTKAIKKVCDDWRENALAIRSDDQYASHITEAEKEEFLKRSLLLADDLESGRIHPTFTDWQRINIELTGECVALLG